MRSLALLTLAGLLILAGQLPPSAGPNTPQAILFALLIYVLVEMIKLKEDDK